MKKIVIAALLISSTVGAAVSVRPSVSIRPAVSVRPPVSVRPSTPVKPVPVRPSSNNVATTALAATAVVLATTAANNAHAVSATVPVADEDADTRLAKVNPTLLTLCTEAQFAEATQWRVQCEDENSGGLRAYCSMLSYQRYCSPATIADIKGKRPARPHYINTYMR